MSESKAFNNGAWLVHHDQKLSAVRSNEFGNITTAGRAARLLSCISKELAWTVGNDRVQAIANANGIKKHEVPGLLAELQQAGLIDASLQGVAVLGVTQANLFQHANDVFEQQNPTSIERAALDLAEHASEAPIGEREIADELADQHKLSRSEKDDLISLSKEIGFVDFENASGEAASLMIHSIDHENRSGPVMRASLLCAALVAVGGDYLGRELAFSDHDTRREYFRNGLIFGRPDRNAGRNFVLFAEKLVTDFVDKTGAAAASIRTGFNRSAERLPVNQFIEFFARPSAGRELMDAALHLENAAFAKAAPNISGLSAEAKTVIFLIADYAGVERRKLMGPDHVQESVADFATSETKKNAGPEAIPGEGKLL